MIVSLGRDGASVLEGAEHQRLSVYRCDDTPLDDALGGLGRVDPDGEHAWLDIQALRDAVDPADKDPEWDAQFDAMVNYAVAKGWVDPEGGSLRAHIEDGPAFPS
jgi:hypothetical protein